MSLLSTVMHFQYCDITIVEFISIYDILCRYLSTINSKYDIISINTTKPQLLADLNFDDLDILITPMYRYEGMV